MTPPGNNPAQRESAQRKRHARIRWQMLNVLHAERANRHGGWVTGRGVVEAMDYCGPDVTPDDDNHARGLLADLATAGYAKLEDNREDRSQPYTLDYITFKITARGIGFVNRTQPPDALIDDGRIIK
jgi:hypothetical protein